MKPTRKLIRRSFLAQVAGGGALGIFGGIAAAQTMPYTGTTDCDSGQGADRPGYGTGVRNRYTDNDTGPQGDARCQGRGPARREGYPSGQGRYSGVAPQCSDSDGGPGADPGGRGRSCGGQTPERRYPPATTRHCTDSDRGTNADPVQQGRHC